MTNDMYALYSVVFGLPLLVLSIKGYDFYQTHTLVTRVELKRLRNDVQSQEGQIAELQQQLDAIRAPKNGRGKPVDTGQFELGLKTDVPKTQKYGPIEVEIEGKKHQVYIVWYAGERTKYLDEGLVLVRRNGIEKWLLPDEVHPRDIKIQPWWYVTETGRHVTCTEYKTREGKKKTVWNFYREVKQPKKAKLTTKEIYE